MTEQSPTGIPSSSNGQEKPRETLDLQAKHMVYPLTIYFLICGILYLWGFWERTGINVLEYIALQDVLKSTALPLAATFIGGPLVSVYFKWISAGIKLPGTGQLSKIVASTAWAHKLIFVWAIVAVFKFADEKTWLLLGLMASVPLSIAISQSSFLKWLPNDARLSVTFPMCVVILCSYGAGVVDSHRIYSSTKFVFVSSRLPSVSTNFQTDELLAPRLLGLLGEHLFLYLPASQSVMVFQASEVKSFELKTFSKPAHIEAKQAGPTSIPEFTVGSAPSGPTLPSSASTPAAPGIKR
jgi:hypothetical protein